MAALRNRFSARLKQKRLEKGLTQENLAERSGYSVQYVSKIEANAPSISLEALERFANALEVDPGALVGGGAGQFSLPNAQRARNIIEKCLSELEQAKLILKE